MKRSGLLASGSPGSFVPSPPIRKIVAGAVCLKTMVAAVVTLAAAFGSGVSHAYAADLYWNTPAGGSWSTASSWNVGSQGGPPSASAPGSSDNAFITLNGTYMVMIDSAVQVASLTVGGSVGTQSLTMANSLTLAANGVSAFGSHARLNLSVGSSLAGPGDVQIDGLLSWIAGTIGGTGTLTVGPTGEVKLDANTGFSRTLSRVMNNQGTVTCGASGWSFAGGVLNNTGMFNVDLNPPTTDFTLTGTGSISNLPSGSFVKRQPGSCSIQVGFTNTGVLSLLEGSLGLTGGGSNDQTFVVPSGTALTLGGNWTYDGNPAITNNGTLTIGSGTHPFNNPLLLANTVNFAGGTITGSGDITLQGQMNWIAGTIAGTGVLNVAPGATVALNANTGFSRTLSRVMNNQGTITWGASMWNFVGGVLNNTGMFNVDLNPPTTDVALSGTGLLNNLPGGSFNKHQSGSCSVQVEFHNTGSLTFAEGSLGFTGGGSNDQTFVVPSGTALTLGGNWTYGGNPAITNNGTLTIGSGTHPFNNPLLLANTVNFAGGTITGSGDITLQGQMNWIAGTIGGTGTLTVGPTGEVKLDANTGFSRTLSRTLNNEGTFYWNASSLCFSGGTLHNKPTGVFNDNSGFDLDSCGGSNVITNEGLYRKCDAFNSVEKAIWVPFANSISGILEVCVDTLYLAGGLTNFSAQVLTGGTYRIEGTGTLKFNNANIVTNNAYIILDGVPSAIVNQNGQNGLANVADNGATGALTILNGRNLTITPGAGIFSNAGTLKADSRSTMTVNGDVTNSGTLCIDYRSRFTAANGGNFTQPAGGALCIEVGGPTPGTNLGWLDVSGAVSLNGDLSARTANGLLPNVLDKFKFLTAGSRIGAFASTTDMEICSSRIFDVLYGPAAGPTFVRLIALPQEFLAGDLDHDGDVDLDDAAILVPVLLGTDQNWSHIARADLNCDGTANGGDTQLLINAVLGP